VVFVVAAASTALQIRRTVGGHSGVLWRKLPTFWLETYKPDADNVTQFKYPATINQKLMRSEFGSLKCMPMN
jgi:hypothetical protein